MSVQERFVDSFDPIELFDLIADVFKYGSFLLLRLPSVCDAAQTIAIDSM